MNDFSKIDMQLATQLTRQGRLDEAMALLRGARPRTAETANEAGAVRRATEGTLPLIDMTAPERAGDSWNAHSDMPGVPPSLGRNTPCGSIAMGGALNSLKRFRPDSSFHPVQLSGAPRAIPLVPRGACFEVRSYSNVAGTREYKLYVPSGYCGQPLPLIVMLHGCTQTPDDFALGTRMNEIAEQQAFFVAYPAQPQSANISRCWNWFNVSDQRRDRGEPSLIAGITRQIIREFAVVTSRVYVAGFSAGGTAAAVMATTYPDLYTAVGIHSGLPCGAARDMPSAMRAMQRGYASSRGGGKPSNGTPTIVFHGDHDSTVNPVNGEQIIDHCRAGANLGISVSQGETAGMQFARIVYFETEGRRPIHEQWRLHGAGHAWSGGSASGSYTNPCGPDASREMVRFFLDR